MTTIAFVNAYLGTNALLLLVALFVWAARSLQGKRYISFAYRDLLHFGYALVIGAVLLPPLIANFDRAPVIPHIAEVWSAPTMHDQPSHSERRHQLAIAAVQRSATLDLSAAWIVAMSTIAAGLLVVLATLAKDTLLTVRLIARATPLRRHGSVRVLISDATKVPFSFWMPTRSYIVLPSDLLSRPVDLRLAIGHEAQHHRQADTKILYVLQFGRSLCWWNPAMHAITRQIRELQEFACDEAVLQRRSGAALDYCRCLLWVAEGARTRLRQGFAAAMASASAHLLACRIEAALGASTRGRKLREIVIVALIANTMFAAVAASIADPIRDRRISAADAQRMVESARSQSSFPITMNARVLAEMNRLLGTPDGRAFLRAGFERMRLYEPMIVEQIERYGLPRELLAVPLVEAGYLNLPQGADRRHGAGLWMFIESTARRFGLVVDETEDQRLDALRETDAALRMLSGLHSRLGDWSLALLAFNGGEWRVARGMRETGSKDAWALVDGGYENDPRYLARINATILIINNPTLLN